MKCSLGISNFLEEISTLSHSIFSPCISLYCSLKKPFLSLLAILWNTAFSWVYLSPLPFTCGSEDKVSACNEGDLGSIPGLGRSPGGGHGNPLQDSCLENHHGQRSLVGCSPWVHKEWDVTKHSTAKHKNCIHSFAGSSAGKESTCNVGDLGSIPGLGRSPGEGIGCPLQYSHLENPHGQRSLVGYSPRSRKESDMSEHPSTHTAHEVAGQQPLTKHHHLGPQVP